MPRIEVICIGTELLTGRVNTHASYLGVKLAEIGLSVSREHTVPDDPSIMLETFREAHRRADVVLSCGGLGPTFDDITRDVWSRVMDRPLRADNAIAVDIRGKFSARGLNMPESNLRQAMVLRGARVLKNANGTAPGQILTANRKTLVLLPGPSRELYPMFEREVLPALARRYGGRFARSKTFLVVGVPESKVDEMVRPLVDSCQRVDGCDVIHGIVASQALITVKFRVEGRHAGKVSAVHRRLSREFRSVLGSIVAGEDQDSLESIVASQLMILKKTVAVAESCTGGLLSKLLTDIPGSSSYFLAGAITYSNSAKIRDLGVSRRHFLKGGAGAVSEVVARAMAEGIRKRAGTDFGVAVTGIAGPSGGSAQKPVGHVHIACASVTGTIWKEFNFKGDRSWIRQRAALMALDLLRLHLREARR